MSQVIVVGGGLAGMSAAHTVLERGGRVLLLEKMAFMGGNSVKATSGINGTLTRAQVAQGIQDNPVIFERDTALSATGGQTSTAPPLSKVLVWNSGPAVEWLVDRFGLDLSLVSRMGGHSQPRCHRGKEKFPGMVITMALIGAYEKLAASGDERARFLTKARVTKLLRNGNEVIGVEYEKDGKKFEEFGVVVLATGGFGADFSETGLLAKLRPELLPLPTTNGEHNTGDGIKLAQEVGADTVDLDYVQVHPTGLVSMDDPNAKILFLAAEALRGSGGLLLDKEGRRFVDELQKRDYVTGKMWEHNKPPYRLILNSAASNEMPWHCNHYVGRRVMKQFKSGRDLAAEMGVSADQLQRTFSAYNEAARTKKDPFGKRFFKNAPYDVNDSFFVAIVTPVVHYCMGGIKVNPEAYVIDTAGTVIPGLYGAGEVNGGIHGKNRLGGSALLDGVVYGRVAGASAAEYLMKKALEGGPRTGGAGGAFGGVTVSVDVPAGQATNVTVSVGGAGGSSASRAAPVAAGTATPASSSSDASAAEEKVDTNKTYTMEEVAKHNTKEDCWVVVNGEVLNVTKFLPDHPGGVKAIVTFAGRDASEEFNMLHDKDVIQKYAPYVVIGKVADAARSRM